MKVILHIGPYKTGSSAVQKALKDSSASLGSNKIFYPYLGNGKNLNHLASILYHKKTDLAVLILDLVKKAKKVKCNTIFMSAEALWNIKMMYDWHNGFESARTEKEILESLERELRKHFKKIEIIYFRRDSGELLVSLYNQLIKDVTDLSLTFCKFEEHFEKFFDYDLALRPWKEIFPSADFFELKYDKNSVDKIAKFLGIKIPQSKKRANLRLNENILFVKWLTNNEKKSSAYRIFKWKKFLKFCDDPNLLKSDTNLVIQKLSNEIFSTSLILYIIAKRFDFKVTRLLFGKIRNRF